MILFRAPFEKGNTYNVGDGGMSSYNRSAFYIYKGRWMKYSFIIRLKIIQLYLTHPSLLHSSRSSPPVPHYLIPLYPTRNWRWRIINHPVVEIVSTILLSIPPNHPHHPTLTITLIDYRLYLSIKSSFWWRSELLLKKLNNQLGEDVRKIDMQEEKGENRHERGHDRFTYFASAR